MIKTIDEAPFADATSATASPSTTDAGIVVMKFGGTSLTAGEQWWTIAALLRRRLDAGLRPVAVLAAVGGVTRALDELMLAESADAAAEKLSRLHDQHARLANDLGLDGAAVIARPFATLQQALAAARENEHRSPREQAAVLACGELLSSAIGTAFLRQAGLNVHCEDARDLLTATEDATLTNTRRYLFARCGHAHDPQLWPRLSGRGEVILTQGFIARNAARETVLLGREGSDTSAAYLAAMLRARRVEMWTDVPGVFSADPRLVPSARLLTELDYEEAQELASTGTKVLHPRCLRPLREAGIPLFVRGTGAPHIAGTRIAHATAEALPEVKGLAVRRGVSLVSLESASRWREPGFLARVFEIFAQHEVAIDRISTSETTLSVTIDPAEGRAAAGIPEGLLRDLETVGVVRVLDGCATVSLVGPRIRAFLPALAPSLAIFEEERIHLVSQAANDLNFSFVIDENQVTRLARKIHASVIRPQSPGHGQSFEELMRDEPAVVAGADPWWLQKRERLLRIADEHPNAFVYDLDSIRSSANSILGLKSVERILFAMKANFNVDVIRTLADCGADFDCVSPGEVRHLREVVPELDPGRILFTPNFAPRQEYAWALDQQLLVTLDNLYPLRAWPEMFAGRRIFVRLDPGIGRGHHQHVRTAGIHSKFGIPRFEVDELSRLLRAAGAEVIGIHAHIGSGIFDPDNWRTVAGELLRVAERFPQADVIDLGGGFGVPEKSGDPGFDLAALDALLANVRREFPRYRLWLEPGRYLVSQAGVLLSRVTQTKGKADMRYVGLGTGMNALIRPALYGAYHEIVNLTRVHEAASELVTVVGPICESGDKLGSDRLLPPSQEGDVMLIANAGAYGRVMSSRYNLRDVPPEIVI